MEEELFLKEVSMNGFMHDLKVAVIRLLCIVAFPFLYIYATIEYKYLCITRGIDTVDDYLIFYCREKGIDDKITFRILNILKKF